MTAHLHAEYVDGCYRCELSRDEIDPLDAAIEAICDELHDLIVSELEHAAEGGRLFSQDPGKWVHERANVIERLIRDTSQVNR